jgi:hypothetical protein
MPRNNGGPRQMPRAGQSTFPKRSYTPAAPIRNSVRAAVRSPVTVSRAVIARVTTSLRSTSPVQVRRAFLISPSVLKLRPQITKATTQKRTIEQAKKQRITAFARNRSNALKTKALAKAKTVGVWKLSSIERGRAIEKTLATTEYKDWHNVGDERGGKFPLVDFQKGNTLVSLKTVDTNGTAWIAGMKDHINDLADRGATVNDKAANMVLDLRVQPGGAPAAQSLIAYGGEKGVSVIIKEFP